MKITLTIEKSPDPLLVGSQMSFGPGGGSLGRAADNDWVLPDPNCYTSGCHARVRHAGAGFVVEDLSTNGTFHNDPERLIGKQRSAELNHGDRLYIGEFVIVVSLEQPQARAEVPDVEDQDSLLVETEAVRPVEPVERDEFDDLLEGAAGADQPPADTSESTLPGDDERRYSVSRELDDMDKSESPAEPDPSARYGQSPEREYFAPPASRSDGDDGIPDEWDALLTGFFEPPSRPDAASSARPGGPAATGPEARKAAPPPPPPPARSDAEAGDRPSPSRPGAGDAAVLQRILFELGIEDVADQVDPEDFAEQLGKVTRMVGEGLMQLLASRAEIKNEFRIDQTRISSSRNNPLKFSPSIEEAMRRVFVERDVPGFISGAEAFEQALNDLRAHQMAILAAVQGAIESVIAQFDPAELETQLKKISPISASAPLIKEAKCWNLFTRHYEDMAANLRQDARQVFIREFAEAYEQASREVGRRIAESRREDS